MKTINVSNCSLQGSMDWRRERLGNFTGSNIHKLMVSGRKKEDYFGQTAISYIETVAAERNFNENVVANDELFGIFVEQTSINSKAVNWGKEQEYKAREIYCNVKNCDVDIPSSVEHSEIDNYAASPDGVDTENDIVLEIKCPSYDTAFRYMRKITDGETLKEVEPKYYWQVMAEIDCCDAAAADFVVYNPFLAKPLHIVRIERNEDDIAKLRERVIKANEYIQTNLSD